MTSPVVQDRIVTSRSAKAWTEILALATVAIAVLGMFLSSPRYAGPDENHHQGTAWYLGANILPPKSEMFGEVPAIITDRPCFAFTPEADTGCIPPRSAEGTSPVRILNYPPVYYWVVAAGQRTVDAVDSSWLDMGGRTASLLLNLGGLALLAWLLRRTTRTWGTYVLLISTPMAAFLWGVVNPSGWEITTGLLFAYVFGTSWWQGLAGREGHRPWKSLTAIAVISLLFGLSRHDAFVWMALLILAVMIMGKTRSSVGERVRILSASAVGLAAGFAWNRFFPAQHVIANETPVADPGFFDYVGWLGQIDNAMADRVRQMLGVLGWLDIPMPQWLMFIVLAGWAMLLGVLFTRGQMPASVLVYGFSISVFLPMVIEVIRWNDWPYWYQGRITLPFTLAFLLLVLMRFGRNVVRPAQAMSIIMGLALAFMVWQNLMRHAFGIRGYLPQRWSSPTMDSPMYWASWACIAALIVISAMRVWLLHRDRMANHEASKISAA